MAWVSAHISTEGFSINRHTNINVKQIPAGFILNLYNKRVKIDVFLKTVL